MRSNCKTGRLPIPNFEFWGCHTHTATNHRETCTILCSSLLNFILISESRRLAKQESANLAKFGISVAHISTTSLISRKFGLGERSYGVLFHIKFHTDWGIASRLGPETSNFTYLEYLGLSHLFTNQGEIWNTTVNLCLWYAVPCQISR